MSTIAGGVGIAALTSAAVLWFTAPGAPEPTKTAARVRHSAWSVTPQPNAWGLDVQRAF